MFAKTKIAVIGAGKPGPITQKVQTIFFDIVQGRRPEYSDWLTTF